MKKRLRFWLLFAVLNTLATLPVNLLLREEGQQALLVLEFPLLLATLAMGWSHLPRHGRKIAAAGFGLLFLLSVVWETYSAVLPGVFGRESALSSDLLFAKNIPFLLDGLPWPGWALAFAGIVVLFVLVGLAWLGAQTGRQAVYSRSGLLVLAGLTLLWGVQHPSDLLLLRRPVVSLAGQASANLERSQAIRARQSAILAADPWKVYGDTHPLAQKPPVLLIFVESYGSAVYRRGFYERYQQIMTDFQQEILEQGWSVVSGLSESPTWGGGSWMAYGSAVLGLQVENENDYATLRGLYEETPYPTLPRWFNTQGYQTRWYVTIARERAAAYDRADERFYGAQIWVRFGDLDYNGPLYGWGPSPPDQFTLGQIAADVRAAARPTFTFYLTQNSHYPWKPLPPLVADWHTLANLDQPGGKEESADYIQARQAYLDALEYTFTVLADFLADLPPDAIVILIGDHQPPTVTSRRDGYTTPIHVISRDPAFTHLWVETAGFTSGLFLHGDRFTANLKHAGLYSLLTHTLSARYGKEPQAAPTFLPDGLQLQSP